MDSLLSRYGLDLQLIIAGLSGGIVHSFFFRQVDPYTVVGSVVSGMLTANYLAPVVAHVTGWGAGPSGFLCGFGAMALVQGLVSAVKLKLGIRNGAKNNGSA